VEANKEKDGRRERHQYLPLVYGVELNRVSLCHG
jgi:hypothetical protein